MSGGGIGPAGLPPGGLAWSRSFRFQASDGVWLRGAIWNPGEVRGHALLLQGRTEYLEKLTVPAAALAMRGYAVAALDWRGQGLSERPLPDTLKGHVDRFDSYHADLAAFTALPEVASLPGHRLVVAHSMGGCIAIGALLRRRLSCDAAIFSAPMLGIALNPVTRAAAAAVVALAERLGQRHLWPPVPKPEEPYIFSGFAGNVLTGDEVLHDWMAAALRRDPRLRLGQAPTLGWLGAAAAEMEWIERQRGPLGVPSLCLLGTDEAVVEPSAIRDAAPRLGFELAEIVGARHELFLETAAIRSAIWRRIDAFLAQGNL